MELTTFIFCMFYFFDDIENFKQNNTLGYNITSLNQNPSKI